MKIIRNVLIGAVFTVLSALTLQAANFNYTVPVGLNAAAATDTATIVSTGPSTGGLLVARQVLAANASRLDYEIELTSCAVTTSRVWYGYSAFTLNSTSNTAASYITFGTVGDPTTRRFLKPDWILPVGAIYAITDGAASSCFLNVREWVSTSPIFQ